MMTPDDLEKALGPDPLSGAGPPRKMPLWRGPEEDGITQSLLSRFLVCRERFRLLAVEGLRPAPCFSHRLEYGNMWHVCEQAHAAGRAWLPDLSAHCRALARGLMDRPNDQAQVSHWYEVCKVQFPVYVDYWSRHPYTLARTPLLQEQVFNVPYRLPSGRTARLRGRWDSVDLVGKRPRAGVWLQENKTKGDVNEGQIKRQLTYDLQTMFYLVALSEEQRRLDDSTAKALLSFRVGRERHYYPLAGVRYNVIRRPLSGGKGSIVRHKGKPARRLKSGKVSPAVPDEPKDAFYGRLRKIIEDDPGSFFFRWNVLVSSGDIVRFRKECLDPILEGLCVWWDWVAGPGATDPFRPVPVDRCAGIHYRHPYGVRNVLDEGGSTDLDEYLATGSEAGLVRADNLFGELS